MVDALPEHSGSRIAESDVVNEPYRRVRRAPRAGALLDAPGACVAGTASWMPPEVIRSSHNRPGRCLPFEREVRVEFVVLGLPFSDSDPDLCERSERHAAAKLLNFGAVAQPDPPVVFRSSPEGVAVPDAEVMEAPGEDAPGPESVVPLDAHRWPLGSADAAPR